MVISIILFVLIVYFILAYNHGVRLKNYVKEAFSTMDVYLKKRWDLIPNLIEIVKNYSGYEKSLLTKITEIRSKDYTEMSSDNKLDTNKILGNAISNLVAVVENYPDIKANQTYENLMQELTSIENDIANSRKYYNGTVRELNNFLEIFPTNIVGALSHMEKAKMFEIETDEKENIKVEL